MTLWEFREHLEKTVTVKEYLIVYAAVVVIAIYILWLTQE